MWLTRTMERSSALERKGEDLNAWVRAARLKRIQPCSHFGKGQNRGDNKQMDQWVPGAGGWEDEQVEERTCRALELLSVTL